MSGRPTWPQGRGEAAAEPRQVGRSLDHARALGGVLVWGGLAGLVVMLVVGTFGGQALGQQPDAQAVQLYQANCSFCHGLEGEGTFRGPPLVGVGKASVDFYLRSGRMPIAEPDDPVVRTEPRFTDEQISRLVEYAGSFGEGPPIPELHLDKAELSKGQQLYQLNCAACHNWDGKGGALVGVLAPRLHPIPEIQQAEAIRVGPGTMPVFGPDVLDDQEVDDIVAYVKYLESPRDAGGFGLAHWGPATEGLAATVGLGLILLVTAWLGKREKPDGGET